MICTTFWKKSRSKEARENPLQCRMCTLTYAGSNIIKEDVKNDERQKDPKLYENQALLAFFEFSRGSLIFQECTF